MFSRFDTIPECDGRTNGQTDIIDIAKTCFSIADAPKNYFESCSNSVFDKHCDGLVHLLNLHYLNGFNHRVCQKSTVATN